ncbi:MAG: murein hydrolase activator EnvC family protein, partial [Alloprevotella sp.]
ELTACKQKYRRAVLYLNRKRLLQNKWMFVLSAKNFRQMYRRMRYASDYSKYLRAQAETIKQKEAAVSKAREAVHAAKKEKDVLLSEAQGEHKRLEAKKKERQGVINELNKKQSQLTTTIAQQKRKYANLNASIDRLIKQEIAAAEARRKKEEARRKAAEEKRRKEEARARAAREAAAKKNKNAKGSNATTSKKSSTSTPAKSTPRYEEEDATDRTLSSGFAANRGRLPIPITGGYAITGRYGQYSVEGLSGVSLDSKGINLTGHSGAQARCVYDGEVSAVANVGGTYVVIVRHGSYYSVYSNLSSVAVRNGQAVKTRQTLGAVAGDGSGGCTLHFQLRKRSGSTASHINPLPWLAR